MSSGDKQTKVDFLNKGNETLSLNKQSHQIQKLNRIRKNLPNISLFRRNQRGKSAQLQTKIASGIQQFVLNHHKSIF